MNKPSAKIAKCSDVSSMKELPEVVVQAFSSYPAPVRETLLKVRALIFQVQQDDPAIGALSEVLRWGEVTYLTEQSKSGSMVRLAMTRSGEPALFFHCGTLLVDRFRSQYAHVFEFEANRALVLTAPIADVKTELADCLKQALRYKLDKA